MSLSIHAKVFLALLLTGALVLLGTQTFVQWSLRRGLIDLAHSREEARIEAIAERLIELYARGDGWAPLRASPRLWIDAVTGHDWLADGRRGRTAAQRTPPWIRRFLATQPEAGRDGAAEWPPPPPPTAPGEVQGAPLERRVMLMDSAGAMVYGRPELLPNARRFPLDLDGIRIGTLAILPGRAAAEIEDLRFVERQGARLGLVALAMLGLVTVLALSLSSRLVRPIQGFRAVAHRLAAGDYAARVPTRDGDEIASLGRDINSLAEALEHTDRTRRQWVADISHELRTPIALLRAHLEAMQDGVRPLEPTEIDRLHADLLRLSRLVDDLNDLAMTDLGALAYRKQTLDLVELLGDALDGFRTQFDAANLALVFHDRIHGAAPFTGDPDRLTQLFGNLLRNSLSYTDRGGRLDVILERCKGNGYRIRFEDSAPGVPPEELPRLFERLHRVDGSRSRDTGGSGLGLTIAKNIVLAHGGRIEAAHAAAGGCAILIELPIEKESEP